jgi:hypothetical protein
VTTTTILGLTFGAWKLVFNHRLMQQKKHSISEALNSAQFLSASLIILVRNMKICSHQFLNAARGVNGGWAELAAQPEGHARI